METYRYTLERSRKKYLCPGCSKKTFVLYIDTKTSEHLPEQYGRCDRELNCAYHLNPYKDGYAKEVANRENGNLTAIWQPSRFVPRIKQPAKMLSIVKFDLFEQSRKAYDRNNFVQWLNKLFDKDIVNALINRYNVGTSKHWPGATIFWQVDKQGKVRTGKIMLYNSETGKRIKSQDKNYINWVHRVMALEGFELRQCYFGEHLLEVNLNKPVGLVESEKTAIIASVYLPQLVWLSVGSLTNLNVDKCQALTKRKVYLFPDLNGFEKWQIKALDLSKLMPGTIFKVSDLLQRNASLVDKQNGLDLADYLIRLDFQKFINNNEGTVRGIYKGN